MPFNLGIGEIVMMAAALGGLAALGYGVIRLLGHGGVSRDELEAEKRDLERRIEALEKRDRLPKG